MTQPPYDPQSPDPQAQPEPGPEPGALSTPEQGMPEQGIRYGLDDEPGAAPYGAGGPPPTGGFTIPGYAAPDPLGDAAEAGFESWARRTVAICRRSAGPVLAILAATSIPPVLVTSVVYGLMSGRLNDAMIADPQTATLSQIGHFYAQLSGVVGVLMLVSVVTSYLTAVGWVAALRIMATDAAGRPREIGSAVRFGLRRGLALWGWYILAYLCVSVGTCFCLVPGIYLALALSMIAPITVFERGVPAFTRSFRLVHGNFWPVVGRLVVLALVVGAYLLLLSCVLNAATGGLDTTSTTAAVPGTGQIVVTSIVQAVLTLPATLVGIAGILAAYVGLRAHEEGTEAYQDPAGHQPVSAASLADAAR